MSSIDVVEATRRRFLGKVGAWLGVLRTAGIGEEREAVSQIEDLGYASIWTGESIGGKEIFAHGALLLAATNRITIGAGIANSWARQPAVMQGGAATLGAAYPGRFLLGVGAGHAATVERTGQVYERPASRMVDYLDAMDLSSSNGPATEVPVARVLAALRPRMLAMARDRADGAHPYFVPSSHTPIAREILGPDKLLIPEQAVLVLSDPAEARRIGRAHMQPALQLPNYVNSLQHLGFTDEDMEDGGSDRLVDALVAWGDEERIAARVREHLDGGADQVLLQPLGNLNRAVKQLESLAPAVLDSQR